MHRSPTEQFLRGNWPCWVIYISPQRVLSWAPSVFETALFTEQKPGTEDPESNPGRTGWVHSTVMWQKRVQLVKLYFSFNFPGQTEKSTLVSKRKELDTERYLEYETIWGGEKRYSVSPRPLTLHTYLHMLAIFLEGHPRNYHQWWHLGTERRERKYWNLYFPVIFF